MRKSIKKEKKRVFNCKITKVLLMKLDILTTALKMKL